MRNYIFAGFRFRLLLVVLSGFFLVPDLAADDVADALRARAAGLYSERAYEQAHKAWQQLAAHGIPEAERPKLDFFIADSLWRSQSGREQLEEARGILTGIIENAPESALAAEAWESLGDSWLASDRDWPRAWEAYQEALAYWAGSTDSELARERYLGETGGQAVKRYRFSQSFSFLFNLFRSLFLVFIRQICWRTLAELFIFNLLLIHSMLTVV